MDIPRPVSAAPADRATLLRRITFDLTGLPPLPDEIDVFEREGNYEQTVDRLLASPRFGERMARRWMDVSDRAFGRGLAGIAGQTFVAVDHPADVAPIVGALRESRWGSS